MVHGNGHAAVGYLHTGYEGIPGRLPEVPPDDAASDSSSSINIYDDGDQSDSPDHFAIDTPRQVIDPAIPTGQHAPQDSPNQGMNLQDPMVPFIIDIGMPRGVPTDRGIPLTLPPPSPSTSSCGGLRTCRARTWPGTPVSSRLPVAGNWARWSLSASRSHGHGAQSTHRKGQHVGSNHAFSFRAHRSLAVLCSDVFVNCSTRK